MKKQIRLWTMCALMFTLMFSLIGCGSESSTSQMTGDTVDSAEVTWDIESEQNQETSLDSDAAESEDNSTAATELYVRFGAAGETFVLHLYDNNTAAAMANHVGTADWQLPIYHYDDSDNWEVMQYYDIPSRYEIPDNAESITSEQAGTVYYSGQCFALAAKYV